MIDEHCPELRSLLCKSVRKNLSETILLSGGLDSSILSNILKPAQSVTIALTEEAPDIEFSRIIARKYSRHHAEVILSLDELLNVVESVIRILKTFNPTEIKNSSVVFAGIDFVKRLGFSNTMTGDGADELFAGYNYLRRYFHDPTRLQSELKRLWEIMTFSSIIIGNSLGVKVLTPFLEERFVEYAKNVTVDSKVGKYSGTFWGKFILRRCFEGLLGPKIAWRRKYAQEEGSGITNLRNILEKQYDSVKFQNKKNKILSDGIHIKDKEQLYYFELFRKHFSLPIDEDCLNARCPDCKGCLSKNSTYCQTCGSFPIKLLRVENSKN